MRRPIPLIFLLDNIKERLKVIELDLWKLCPFVFRLESRLKLPFSPMARRRHQTSFSLCGFLTPFVFLHGLGAFKRGVLGRMRRGDQFLRKIAHRNVSDDNRERAKFSVSPVQISRSSIQNRCVQRKQQAEKLGCRFAIFFSLFDFFNLSRLGWLDPKIK